MKRELAVKSIKKNGIKSLKREMNNKELILPVSLKFPIDNKFNLHLTDFNNNHYLLRTNYKDGSYSSKKIKIDLEDNKLISRLIRTIMFFSNKYKLEFNDRKVRFIGIDERIFKLFK